MGSCLSKPGPFKYYNSDGELVSFDSSVSYTTPYSEYAFVSISDSVRFFAGTECYMVNAKWLGNWLQYAMKKDSKRPGNINNDCLLNRSKDRILPNVKAKIHFRPVNKKVWEFLFKLYGGGPVISFKGSSNITRIFTPFITFYSLSTKRP